MCRLVEGIWVFTIMACVTLRLLVACLRKEYTTLAFESVIARGKNAENGSATLEEVLQDDAVLQEQP